LDGSGLKDLVDLSFLIYGYSNQLDKTLD
jgi:hypothetical protein